MLNATVFVCYFKTFDCVHGFTDFDDYFFILKLVWSISFVLVLEAAFFVIKFFWWLNWWYSKKRKKPCEKHHQLRFISPYLLSNVLSFWIINVTLYYFTTISGLLQNTHYRDWKHDTPVNIFFVFIYQYIGLSDEKPSFFH